MMGRPLPKSVIEDAINGKHPKNEKPKLHEHIRFEDLTEKLQKQTKDLGYEY